MRNRYAIIWVWLFLIPLAVDYKGEESASHLAQVLLAVPAIFAGMVLVLIGPRFTGHSRVRTVVTAALCLTLFGSLVPELVQHNDPGNYMRVLLPFVLFLLGYRVACSAWDAKRIGQIERVLYYAMSISLVYSFVNGMLGSGDLETVRFRIVSATLLGLQAMLLHEFVLSRRVTKMTLMLFIGTVMVELLSVTRSLVVGTVLLFCYATWLGAPSVRHLIKAGVRAVIVAAMIGSTAVAVSMMFPEVAAHWTQRVFAAKMTRSGMDPTTVTRLAELKDQYDQVTSSTTSLLLGMGYGHYYRYSPVYLWALEGQITKRDFYAIHDWGAGHNFWGYQLFAGGLMFGLGLPVAVLYATWCGTVSYRRWRRLAPDMPFLPVMGRSLLMVASLLAMSIGGNPLGPRFSGLVFGVALGLLVGSHARLSQQAPAKAIRSIAPATPAAAQPMLLPGTRIKGA
ncbi:hypothetical protein [Paraburkholderia sp. BL10I2N1]|uniref:hypothetical protein n=1 Tax=Paraburkholderia sp. BL10I2N1 TaxID=1938796 RepID=UPI001061D250|nr:hypothetical protein [Paraburkholderia sp. BL10I2N1]TDN67443.1 hypothetical protein B0G77_0720 [Paraburkholderia sp. BL10I2N1]